MSSAAEVPSLPAAIPPFKIALYENKFGKSPTQLDTTWAAFVSFIVDFVEESPCTITPGPQKCIGAECPHKAFSTIPDNPMAWAPTEIVGKRLDVNVRAITLLVLDFDHLDREAATRVVEALAPYEHVRHTTHNHRQDDIAFRACLALSRPVPASAWHRFLAAAVAHLGVTVVDRKGKRQPDPTCKNRSRYYYRPSHPKDGPRDAEHVLGRVLDVDEVLAWGAANLTLPQAQDEAAPIPESTEWNLEGKPVQDAIDCISRFFPPTRRHELALALGGMLRRHGATEEDAHYIIEESFRQGGSENPKERAKTIAHTYSAAPESAITGFTRVADILDEEVAEELGEYFTDARNEAFLRGLGPAPAGAVSGAPPTTAPATPPAVLDLAQLRRVVSDLATKRAKSDDRDDQTASVLLRRVLDSRPLARPAGAGDVETRAEGEERGIGREKAVKKIAAVLAFALPQNTPWDAVSILLDLSLRGTYAEPGVDWLSVAQRAFKRAQETRLVEDAKRAQEEAARVDEVRRELVARAAVSSAPSTSALPPVDPNWRDKLTKGAAGAIAATHSNLQMILECDELLRGTLCWNRHDKTLEVRGGVLAPLAQHGDEAIATGLQNFLSLAYGMTSISYQDVKRRIMLVARACSYDPLADHFNSLEWDGVPRFDRFLIDYFGVADSAHARRISRRWMLGAISRAFEPGSKFDNVLVFEQLQGAKKTTAFEALGGAFYCSTAIDLRDKDAKMLAACSWLIELAEMDSLRRNEHSLQKNFLTQRWDKFRPPFAASMQKFPRQCVFVGTTNEYQYLSDPTGNRRYWPFKCGVTREIDLPGLLRDRDQLWAEAVSVFLAHRSCPVCAASTDTVQGQAPRCADHRWWLDRSEEADAAQEVEQRVEDTPWMSWRERILVWWRDLKDRPESVTVARIAYEVGELPPDRHTQAILTTIGIALSKMGFIRKPSERVYLPSAALVSEPYVPRRGLFVIAGGKK